MTGTNLRQVTKFVARHLFRLTPKDYLLQPLRRLPPSLKDMLNLALQVAWTITPTF
jgi:hypothetical protein